MLISYLVSRNECDLLETIEEIGHGEIYGLEISSQSPTIEVRIASANRDLLNAIRNGLQYIDVLTIHDGEARMAEVNYKTNGFSCRRKIKFPTVLTED